MKNKIMSIPEGTRDLFYLECKVIDKVVGNINRLFNKWGYDEVITPTLEFYDTFNNYQKSIKQEVMYKFFDNKGKILALKADGTIPIARLVSTKLKDCELPIRLRYSSRVFRVNESLAGKQNEYMECGIEFIGGETIQSDIEVLVMSIKSLIENGLDDFKIEIGHIGIFNCICEEVNIEDNCKEVLGELIEQKKLVELEELLNNINISEKDKEIFKSLPWLFGSEDILTKAKSIMCSPKGIENIEYLNRVYIILKELGYSQYITFDLGITPRGDYYSGIMFKGYIKGIGDYVLHGGRYDNLMKSYGSQLKAIGFSININELSKVINKDKFLEKDEVYKIYYNHDNLVSKFNEAEERRKNGERVVLLEGVE